MAWHPYRAPSTDPRNPLSLDDKALSYWRSKRVSMFCKPGKRVAVVVNLDEVFVLKPVMLCVTFSTDYLTSDAFKRLKDISMPNTYVDGVRYI